MFTLEELAAEAGVPARTIRYYQAEKLLPAPGRDERDNRVAVYGEEHLDRLRLIGELRDRGLKLPAIRALLDQGDGNQRVADWLGLDDSLRRPWADDRPRIVDRAELEELLDGTPRGTAGQLEDAGLLSRQGTSWLIGSPQLFDLTVGLVREGVPVELVVKAGGILEEQLRRAADRLVELFVKAVNEGFGGAAEVSTMVGALRPVAGRAASLIFAMQLQRATEELLADTKRIARR